ncbi:MAG: cation:proton antiporter [Proteobacteria bacterium]|nr:cation:proton antiporter [Pseudomonadota bacterium]
MDGPEILHDVLVFLVAAVVVVPVFRRLRSSPVLGYLAAGLLIGPHGLAFIRDTESAHTLAEFGVVFLLFMIGLELSFGRLRVLKRYVFGLGSLQVAVTGLLIGGIAWKLGATVEAAAIIGGGLALSSTAFVLQLLVERGERATRFGQVSFAILLLQDIAVVPLLILVTLLGQGEGSFIAAVGGATIRAVVALVLVVGIGRLILRPIYRIIAGTKSSELFVATTLLTVLGTGWLVSLGGLSMALGAFLAGLLLSETEYRHQVEADIQPFRGILLGLFFMTVGMSINIPLVGTHVGQIAALFVALLIGKSIVTAALCRGFGLPFSVSVRAGMLLSQGGEFGFILFASASALGVIPMETAQVLLAVIALTMAATPAMDYLGNRGFNFLAKQEREPVTGTDEISDDLEDHLVIAGFGRVGQTVASVLSAGGIPFVALDLDPDRVSKCRRIGLPVFFGDAGQIEVLKAAGANRAKGAVITIDQPATASRLVAALKEYAPDLEIFVRARDLSHSRQLEIAGATAVVPETIEASLQLGGIVMNAMGITPDEVAAIIDDLRQDDYEKLREIVPEHKDNKEGS